MAAHLTIDVVTGNTFGNTQQVLAGLPYMVITAAVIPPFPIVRIPVSRG